MGNYYYYYKAKDDNLNLKINSLLHSMLLLCTNHKLINKKKLFMHTQTCYIYIYIYIYIYNLCVCMYIKGTLKRFNGYKSSLKTMMTVVTLNLSECSTLLVLFE